MEPDFLERYPVPSVVLSSAGALIVANDLARKLLRLDHSASTLSELTDFALSSSFKTETAQHVTFSSGLVVMVYKVPLRMGTDAPVEPDILLSLFPADAFQLFDDVEAGIYSIGADGERFLYVNRAASDILGYDSVEDLLAATHHSVRRVYSNEQDFLDFINLLGHMGVVVNHPLRMKRKDGRTITILVTAKLIRQNGRIIRRDGVFTYVPEYDRLQTWLRLARATYEVEYIHQADGHVLSLITFCNEEFARMFGFGSVSEIVNIVDIRTLYANPAEADRFEEALRASAADHQPLSGHIIRVRKVDGTEFWISVDCEQSGPIAAPTGRRGTVIDVTPVMMTGGLVDAQRVRALVHTFMAPVHCLRDIADLIHTETLRFTRLGSLEDPVDPRVLDAEWKATTEDTLQSIYEVIESIHGALDALVQAAGDMHAALAESGMQAGGDGLQKTINDLRYYTVEGSTPRKFRKRTFFIQSRAPVLAVQRFIIDMSNANVGLSPKADQATRAVRRVLKKLDNLYLLYLAAVARSEMAMTQLETQILREYLLRDRATREKLDLRECDLEDLVLREVYALGPEAASKRLEIIVRSRGPLLVKCSSHLITRMIGYLLDNAVKYSFTREGFITVRCSDRGEDAELVFENYGVGMTQEEIDSGELLRLGKRGALAWDRNREGSGIGLAEANRIASLHGGGITLESKPPEDAGEITKDTPHRNRVTVRIKTGRGRG